MRARFLCAHYADTICARFFACEKLWTSAAYAGVRAHVTRGKVKIIFIFFSKSLAVSEKSSTFAPDFKKKATMIERTPYAYVADIEVMTGKSNMTARRIMWKIRKFYGIEGRKHPSMHQVREYFRANQ